MTPVEIAAIISGCFATGSVFLTAAVAFIGFRTTRSVTAKAVAAGSQDTVRALNAARDDRLWEKRAAAYEETVAYLLFRQHERDNRSSYHIMGRDMSQATRWWFGGYKPPGGGEIQGRLVAYASDAIVAACEDSSKAETEAFVKFMVWKSAYDRMLKERPDLDFSDDDPEQVRASEGLHSAQGKAREKDQALIKLIRSELHSRPSV